MPEIYSHVIIGLTFLLAGFSKGVVGFGLPTISLGILALFYPLTDAISLLLIPSLVTNFWQALAGKYFFTVFKRLWTFLVFAALLTAFGAIAWKETDGALLTLILGGIVGIYAMIGIQGIRIPFSVKHEKWASPIAGAVNGILTGMTGSFVFPSILYLQTLGFRKDALIQAMGIVFSVSTVMLWVMLDKYDLLDSENLKSSAFALIPATVGMVLGQQFRKQLSEKRFQKLVYFGLLFLGLSLGISSLFKIF